MRWLLPVLAILVICSVVGGSVVYEWNYGTFGIIGPQPTIETTSAGRVIKVPPGGNIQAALELATSGDTIELQAGAVYSGTITLPNKPLTDYVTIQTSAVGNLPMEKRVSPPQRSSMATITAGMLGRPAIATAKGAHHYRFIGIEFASTSSTYNYGLVILGNGETAPNLPHHIEIDRSYLRPNKTGVVRRGIALNSADTIIKNSYIEGFGFPGEETQGICGWTGTRNVKILNNYIEGGAENIMFGGADPASADLIPTDIEVHGNYLNKPLAWADKVSVKTLFELKNSKRVQFTGNLMTNNWKGSAFRITIRNQDNGAPFSTIEDVEISGNIIVGAGEGINILGSDDTYPSQMLKRLTIKDNLFLDLGGEGFEGSGYFIQVASGDTITIENNTVFNRGNIITFYGDQPRAFVFTNNVTGHGLYGIHGPIDVKSPTAKAMIHGNIIFNNMGVGSGDFNIPPGNEFVENIDRVGFSDRSAQDFRLKPGGKYCPADGKCAGISFPFFTNR